MSSIASAVDSLSRARRRQLLGVRLGVRPESIELACGERGKPALACSVAGAATPPARVESEVERVVNTDGDHAVVILRALNAECLGQVRPLTIAGTPWQYGG